MIYFDNNATTFMPPVVKTQICASLDQGNPSADYPLAQKSAETIKHARETLLNICSVSSASHMAIFTSGASESNNYILRIMSEICCKRRIHPHFILSAIEHKTSLVCAKQLADCGLINLTLIAPAADGTVPIASVINAMTQQTVLISIMSTNNETGAVNSIAELVNAARRRSAGIYIHCDCVQSFGKEPPNLSSLSLDAISISFHKVYGPTSAGALILRRDSALRYGLCAMIAGTQNFGFRGGTENVSLIAGGIAGVHYAMKNRAAKNSNLRALKETFLAGLMRQGQVSVWSGSQLRLAAGFNFVILGDPARSVPSTILFSIVHSAPGNVIAVCNQKMKSALYDEARIIVSIGSACNKNDPSHVLAAMKVPRELYGGVLRVSFGDTNNKKEISIFMGTLAKILSKWKIRRTFDVLGQ